MLHIDAGIPGGAVENVRILEDGAFGLDAPLDGSPQGMWFYFRVRHAAGQRLTFRLMNLHQVLGRSFASVLPVVQDGPGQAWRRLRRSEVESGETNRR